MSDPSPRAAALPAWFDPSEPPRHDDLAVRVVLPAAEADWRASPLPGLELRLLEHIGGETPRVSAQLRLAPGVARASLGSGADLELVVQDGEIEASSAHGEAVWPAGLYVRLPVSGDECFDELRIGAGGDGGGGAGDDIAPALIYVATGHIASSDAEQRRIDTRDEGGWLPGPVEGTEVMPLHGHGSSNVLLIRWLGAVAFRPRLDPLGEEILVLEGCLHDAESDYPAGTWIRNPVPAWQSWAGDPGTVVYYKNGHFATPPDARTRPDPAASERLVPDLRPDDVAANGTRPNDAG